MTISRRAILRGAGASAFAGLAGAQLIAAAPVTAAQAAQAIPATSRNSVYTRSGAGPLYWIIYGWSFPHNAPIPESEWKANVDWVAEEFAPHGYRMVCTDGWIEGAQRTNPNGYILTYNDSWEHDFPYWSRYVQAKGMKLGIYYNPLWVARSAVEDPSKTVAGRPDIKIADLVNGDDFFDGGQGLHLYWLDVTKPGAKEYLQGYVRYFRDLGVPYLRVDFLSWYETGTDGGRVIGKAHGSENYATALRWMNEAAGDDIELSLVMPHLYNHAAAELKNGDMVRINNDAFSGGWENLSAGRQGWQNDWSQWKTPFSGFTGFSDISGRGQLILDGDFLMMNTFANDDERRTAISLFTVAGSPLAISDLHNNIGSHAWLYKNAEVLELHNLGLVGKPYYYNGTSYAVDGSSRDTERWAGQLPDGSWAVALFNRSDDAAPKTQSLKFDTALGLTKDAFVRDLWAHEDLGWRYDVSAELPPHGCKLVRVYPRNGGLRRYQAAFATWAGGAKFNNNHSGYAAMGFVDKLESPGAAVTFAVLAHYSGTYPIHYRYANATGQTGTVTVSVERENRSAVQAPFTLSLPNLADWGTWATVQGEVQLTKGVNLITIGVGPSDTGRVNLNYIDVVDI